MPLRTEEPSIYSANFFLFHRKGSERLKLLISSFS
jgi:hypothetical protein